MRVIDKFFNIDPANASDDNSLYEQYRLSAQASMIGYTAILVGLMVSAVNENLGASIAFAGFPLAVFGGGVAVTAATGLSAESLD